MTPRPAVAAAAFAGLLATAIGSALAADSAPDFSAQLDRLWNYDKPAESEARFRVESAKFHANAREGLETATQIARSLGLQRRYADADAVLDGVALGLADTTPTEAMPRVRVRYLLERGRTRNSGGDPKAAVPLFKEAVVVSQWDTLPDADFYRVDALHMLGIAAPQAERLAWDRKALAVAEVSASPRARGWAASLNHNIGWVYFEAGDPKTALTHWQKELALREAAGKLEAIRVARWTVARGYRALGQLDDAQRIQLELAAETERAGEPDGYIYEELAEIEFVRGNPKAAARWAAKAHALLAEELAGEPARLARLADMAKGAAP